MGTILGIVQSWWSVAGLCLDIVGVGVLALEAFRSTGGELSFLRKHEEPGVTVLNTLGPYDIDDRYDPLATDDMPPSVRLAFERLDEERSIDQVGDQFGQRVRQHIRSITTPRRRWIIASGAGLIAVGFFLQIIGAWPL